MTRPAGRFDVLIVGAGPAGSSLACHLARTGVSVALVDARFFPRSKPCGDAISPGATPLLRELGAWEPLRAHPERGTLLGGWRIRSHGGSWTDARFSQGLSDTPPEGLAIDRLRLDQILLDQALGAGATLFEGTRVFAREDREGRLDGLVARGPNGKEQVYRARLVVGADGLRSRVARLFGTVQRGPHARLAFVSRYRGVSVQNRLGELRLSGEGVLGYAPTSVDTCNVTVVVPLSLAPRSREEIGTFVSERIRRYDAETLVAGGELARKIEVTGPFQVAPSRRTVPGGLLVGDAVGYFDPLTGQGIHRALYSAKLAARTIQRCLTEPEAEHEALRGYERSLDAWLGPSRRLQHLIDGVVSRRALMEPAARVLRARSALASRLVDATGDRLPSQDLLRPARWLAALGARGKRSVRTHRRSDAHA